MYVVLTRFADLQDKGYVYEAGESYPRLGFEVSDERIAELAGSDNRMHYPLIKAVGSPVSETKDTPTETTDDADKPGKKTARSRKKE